MENRSGFFAVTTLYHFLFVPLTIGLGWQRSSSSRGSSACGSSVGTCTLRRSGSSRSARPRPRTSSSPPTRGCSTPSATRSARSRTTRR